MISLGIQSNGLELCREFVKLEATIDEHIIYFDEFYLSPIGERIGSQRRFYRSYPDRIEYWNQTLGDPVIIPAIEGALLNLQLEADGYWHGTKPAEPEEE